jgi:hypothetical protein
MNRKSWLGVIGAATVALVATGCKDPSVRDYLGKDGPLYKYLDELSIAVCQLEVNNDDGLEEAKRICPGGPGDRKPIPSYPPQ